MSTIILEVNEVQRALSASGGAFVAHDKEVDIVRFSLMSGFADVVLDEYSALRVMYQRPGESQVRAQTLTYHDTDGLRNYYDWNLLPSDLAEKGTLTVALCILRTDGDVEEWHTTPYQIRVLGSIHTDDSDEGDESITPTVAQRVAVLESVVQSIAGGAPIVVASTSAMTDTSQIYVLSTDGNWYYHNGTAWVAGGEYGAVSTDTTLTQSGAPADAKAVGDEIIRTAGVVEEMECGLTEEVKTALLACFEQVAWIGADGQTYYDALETALNKKRSLSSISTVFTQGSAVIYDTDELYALKQYLTVTASYDDGSTKEVNNYTLSGKLVAGTSTITAAYNNKTTTFNVAVTHQAKIIESISATFSSSASITTDNVLDDLRPYLTVRASYSDGSTNTITNYTLSGSLNVGANTITVAYNNRTATFTVNVTEAQVVLQSISAVFNQGSAVIYTDNVLDDLRPYLTVTARYSDSTTQTVTGYTLSGTLTAGTSTITASYDGKTTTFTIQNVIDFYNIWEWDSTNTDHTKLTRTPTAAFEKVINNEKLGIDYADSMVSSNTLRGFAVTKGRHKMRNYSDGSVAEYYPIPIPATAKKLTAAITPSTQKLAVYVFKYTGNGRQDGYDYELVAPEQIGYVTGEYVLNFASDSNLFLTFNCTPNSGNYSNNPNPNMHILFE